MISMGTRARAVLKRGRSTTASMLSTLADRVAPPPPKGRLKRVVGGSWERLGSLQFEYLKAEGLEPGSRLLDIGCGVLRGGRHFIDYLEPGHYWGIDAAQEMIDGARGEVVRSALDGKKPTLRQTDAFDVDFGVAFDFALAQSVFTHIPLNSIALCLHNVAQVLRPGGCFFATYFPVPVGSDRWSPLKQPAEPGLQQVVTYGDRNPYHYEPEDFAWMCRDLPLEMSVRGLWGHPHNQQMIAFTRT